MNMAPSFPARALLVIGLALVAWSAAAEPAPPRSLNDARKAVHEGTTDGIVLIPARSKAPAAPTTVTAASSPTPATTPADPKDERGLVTRVLSGIRAANPPSGQPLSTARRLESPGLGIALPTTASAASAPER